MTNVYFISGTMCTEDLWQFIFPKLENITPIHVDISSASSFEEINEIILKTIHIPSIIIGFSLGGFAVMNFAAYYPEKVEKLAVVAASAKGLEQNEIKLRKSTIDFLEKHNYKGISQTRIQQFLHPNNHQNPEITSIIKKMDGDLGKNVLIRQLKATSQRLDITEKLVTLNKPVLLISSENDTLVEAVEIKKLSRKMLKATYVNIKNCGHMIPIEKPKELSYLLSSFLNF